MIKKFGTEKKIYLLIFNDIGGESITLVFIRTQEEQSYNNITGRTYKSTFYGDQNKIQW